MYGANLYGGNEYGSKKLFGSIVQQVIKLRTMILQSTYGIVNAIQLRFRSMTLSDPETSNQTLEL